MHAVVALTEYPCKASFLEPALGSLGRSLPTPCVGQHDLARNPDEMGTTGTVPRPVGMTGARPGWRPRLRTCDVAVALNTHVARSRRSAPRRVSSSAVCAPDPLEQLSVPCTRALAAHSLFWQSSPFRWHVSVWILKGQAGTVASCPGGENLKHIRREQAVLLFLWLLYGDGRAKAARNRGFVLSLTESVQNLRRDPARRPAAGSTGWPD